MIAMEIAMDVDTPKKHGPTVDVSTMAQLLAQSTASNVPRFVGRHKEVASKSALLRLPVVCIHSPAVESKSGNPPGKCYGNPRKMPGKCQETGFCREWFAKSRTRWGFRNLKQVNCWVCDILK
jgi:hypothetical protein